MNIKTRKYGFIFGAVAITLLIISNATAVTLEQTETPENEQEIESYQINPETCLTTDDLPMLYTCLAATNDPEITQLIQDIINIIEDQGYASNEDIQQLELPESLGSSTSGVDFPVGIINAVDTSGVFTCPIRLLIRWTFCAPVFLWQITLFDGGYLAINGQGVSGPATVCTMLFIGWGRAKPGWPFTSGDPWIYGIHGIGFGISIDTNSQTSTSSSSPSSQSQPTTYTTTSITTTTYETSISPTNN